MVCNTFVAAILATASSVAAADIVNLTSGGSTTIGSTTITCNVQGGGSGDDDNVVSSCVCQLYGTRGSTINDCTGSSVVYQYRGYLVRYHPRTGQEIGRRNITEIIDSCWDDRALSACEYTIGSLPECN